MMRRVFAWADDWINPIVVKELRQAVKSRFVTAVIFIFLLLQLAFVGMRMMLGGLRGDMFAIDYQGGRDAFMTLEVILLATCMLFIPLYTALRLAAERNDSNTDLLFITTIKPFSIISGKILSAIVLAILIFSTSMPFMGLTYYLRGISWPMIMAIVGIDFVVVMASVQFMVFLAVIPASRVFQALLGLFGLGTLLFVFSMTISGVVGFLMTETADLFDRPEFYATVGGFLGVVLAATVQFFAWSVALASAPTSNRSLIPRLYMLVMLAATGALACWMSIRLGHEAPLVTWMVLATMLVTAYFLVTINERREWSPRLARGIPKFLPLRLLAFLFYSGAAGGILFSLMSFGVIVAVCVGFVLLMDPAHLLHSHIAWHSSNIPGFGACATGFMYAYCYAMTGILVQRLLFPWLRHIYTWAVALGIFVVGLVVPTLISLLMMMGEWRYENDYLWMLSNPFAAMVEVSNEPYNYGSNELFRREAFALFIMIWAGIVTAISVPWFVAQFRLFKRREGGATAPVDLPSPLAVEEEEGVLVAELVAAPPEKQSGPALAESS